MMADDVDYSLVRWPQIVDFPYGIDIPGYKVIDFDIDRVGAVGMNSLCRLRPWTLI